MTQLWYVAVHFVNPKLTCRPKERNMRQSPWNCLPGTFPPPAQFPSHWMSNSSCLAFLAHQWTAPGRFRVWRMLCLTQCGRILWSSTAGPLHCLKLLAISVPLSWTQRHLGWSGCVGAAFWDCQMETSRLWNVCWRFMQWLEAAIGLSASCLIPSHFDMFESSGKDVVNTYVGLLASGLMRSRWVCFTLRSTKEPQGLSVANTNSVNSYIICESRHFWLVVRSHFHLLLLLS